MLRLRRFITTMSFILPLTNFGKNFRMESDSRFLAGSALIWSRSKLSVGFTVDPFFDSEGHSTKHPTGTDCWLRMAQDSLRRSRQPRGIQEIQAAKPCHPPGKVKR